MTITRTRLWSRLGLATLGCMMATGCVRPLTVARERTVPFNDSDAMEILSRMGQVLAVSDSPDDFACAGDFQQVLRNVPFETLSPDQQNEVLRALAERGGSLDTPAGGLLFLLQGSVQDFQGPRIIMTDQDLRDVFGKPAFVKVVGSIFRCGDKTTMTTLAGCAPVGSLNTVAVADLDNGGDGLPSPEINAVVWAHEYGHATGLDHANDPLRVMNPVVSPNSRRITRDECVTYTRLVDSDGPDGSLLDPGVPILDGQVAPRTPDESLQHRPAGMSVQEFVHQPLFFGLGYSLKDDFGAADVAPLLEMLDDPAEAGRRDKILALLSLIGDEQVAGVIMAHVEELRAAPVAWTQANELTSALLGLGALANHNRSDAVVSQLRRWAELSSWSAESDALAQHIASTSMMALAMSGMEPARAMLIDLAAQTREPAEQARMNDILRIAETVAARGLGAYMNGE